MIKVIFFDLGGVIVHVNERKVINGLAAHSVLTPEQIVAQGNSSIEKRQLELGEIALDDFYRALRKSIGLNLHFSEFEELFCDIISPNEQILTILEKLRGAAQLGIISNTSDAHYQRIVQMAPIVDKMEPKVLSFQVQLLKPDQEIFSYALERANCSPAEALFIDDKRENVASAAAFGLHTVHFNECTDLIGALRAKSVLF